MFHSCWAINVWTTAGRNETQNNFWEKKRKEKASRRKFFFPQEEIQIYIKMRGWEEWMIHDGLCDVNRDQRVWLRDKKDVKWQISETPGSEIFSELIYLFFLLIIWWNRLFFTFLLVINKAGVFQENYWGKQNSHFHQNNIYIYRFTELAKSEHELWQKVFYLSKKAETTF